MSWKRSAPPNWVDRLAGCLENLVDYERWVERQLSSQMRRAEAALGVRSDSHGDEDEGVRDRVSDEYWTFYGDTSPTDSEYRRNVSLRLNRLQEVLVGHPALKDAMYRAEDGRLALGLNLGVSRRPGHQLIFTLMGLVDHAVEHGPRATAETLAQVIERGEDRDLSCYSILLFRGLHVERRHDFPGGLSVISFEEARRYLPDDRVRQMLEVGDLEISRESIGAVVFEIKWGPLVVPAGGDLDGMEWPGRYESFRDDAILLLDVLAVTHRQPVRSSRTHTTVVERQVEHLMGLPPRLPRFFRNLVGSNTSKLDPPMTPAVLEEKLSECEQLAFACSNDVRLRIGLSRLASSLSRTGMQAALDRVLDVTIALEVIYQLDNMRGKGDQLSLLARCLIGGDREDLNWIRRTAKSTYSARNDVIHEGKLPQDADQIYSDAFELGRRTLLHPKFSMERVQGSP